MLNNIPPSFLEKIICKIFVFYLAINQCWNKRREFHSDFLLFYLRWLRLRPNVPAPTGSGSATLHITTHHTPPPNLHQLPHITPNPTPYISSLVSCLPTPPRLLHHPLPPLNPSLLGTQWRWHIKKSRYEACPALLKRKKIYSELSSIFMDSSVFWILENIQYFFRFLPWFDYL